MFPLPDENHDIVKLADWLEINAISAGDKNTSIADLKNAVSLPLGRETADELVTEVIIEIERRISGAEEAYPFIFEHGSLLVCKEEDQIEYSGYIFCLCLSYFGWEQEKGDKLNPRNLFEELSSVAAANYVGGQVFILGTSRRGENRGNFYQSLKELISMLGEGGEVIERDDLNPQDDHVDLVAWRHFPDRRQNKFVLFGQCASGNNWREKLTEMNPDSFWDLWTTDPKYSPLIKSFFFPHRIYQFNRWIYAARYSESILFDRCRIAKYSYANNDSLKSDGRFHKWSHNALGL